MWAALVAAIAGNIGLAVGVWCQRRDRNRRCSELRSASRSLARRDEQLRRLIAGSGDAFVAMNEAGVVTGWSGQAVATFGYEAVEAIGRPLHELVIPEEFRSAHLEGMARFLATGEGPVLGQRLELEALRCGGERFPIEISAWALASSEGWTFNALIRDISEPRRQQEDLADREQELHLTQQCAATGMAIVGLDGRWIQVNPALCALAGRPCEEMLASSFDDVIHLVDADKGWLVPLLDGEAQEVEVEGRCEHPDGALVWVRLRGSLLRSGRGDPLRLILQVLDIDEHRRDELRLAGEMAEREDAEREVQREHDFLALVLATMREGYFSVVDGEIVDVNKRLCTLVGFDRDELVGQRPPYSFLADEDIELSDGVSSVVGDAGGGDVEVDLRSRRGEPVPVALSIRPACGFGGPPQSFIAIVNDLSASKRREETVIDMTSRDPLTGLYNRRAIDEQFAQLDADDAVIVLDLDHFRRVNETFGRATGDEALASLASCISVNLREGDWAGRLGGEEFLIVVRRGGPAGASSVVNRLRESWAGSDPLTTFSAGIAVHARRAEPRQTLAQADEAMYLAKQRGRNRTEVFASPAPV